jgi:ABC-2 type transport system permease protein
MPAPKRAQPFPIQLFNLTVIQLANWRWSWRGMLLSALLIPTLSTAGLSLFIAHSDTQTLGYVLTGNLVVSLLFGTFERVSGHFAYMRIVGRLDFFATLPITRVALILATVIAFLVLALPSLFLTLILGALILGIHLVLSPWLVVVIPLIGIALCGLGALIGIVVRTPEEVNSVSILATFMMIGFGPVIVPPDRLPGIVRWSSLVSPATYAASALRQTVLGRPDRIPLGIDLAVLSAFLIGSLWLVGRRMDWRKQ